MQPNITIRERIARAVFGDHTVITLLLGMLALLLASGFLVSHTVNSNYTLLTDFAPFIFWAEAFFIYGAFKIHGVLYRTPFFIKLITSIAGMWLWSYLVLSFVIFDITPIAPTEMMLFLTGICEVWTLALNIFDSKHSHARRETDDIRD